MAPVAITGSPLLRLTAGEQAHSAQGTAGNRQAKLFAGLMSLGLGCQRVGTANCRRRSHREAMASVAAHSRPLGIQAEVHVR